ncbi:hypothetical protein GCM10028796_58470 [Ramlibacter monticola]|uniref:DUF4175 domain-containing protein n=1 Tax=Ramlibacter monticola TaxID=1926872 RepID=A0A936Z2Z3_9BURK|nr:hypothetical protein [Ramlibacter monticola]MBL0394014.1 hypothetical protein [Ramlibacter monticola]
MNEQLRRVWFWPLVLAVFTTTGLVSALFSEGWGDVWAWVALATPLAAIGWCCSRGAPARSSAP